MKQPYEKPFIKKLQSSFLNKFGVSSSLGRNVRSAIDGVAIDDLVAAHGSPLFVFSEKTIRRRYQQHYRAFSTRYPNVVFGWSYKTNYLKAICGVMHDEGAIAEVVSGMEYEKAKALGIPGRDIVFNGPHKPLDVLRTAMADGVTLNVDHLSEIDDLEIVADELGRELEVGLRLNLDAGIYPQWSRFGFNLESGQALDAVRRILRGGKLKLTGLHCHIGTYITDATAYGRLVEKLVRFKYALEDEFDVRIESLDIGGGFPSRNRLKGTYLTPDISNPPADDYAECVCDALLRELRPDDRPRLVVESGRALVDDAGYLVTSIVAVKRLADGTRSYVADAGINLLYTAFWYDFQVETDRELHGASEPSVVYGPMCMNIDVIAETIDLPPLERGNRLILSPVGAYNVTQWMQFIEYRPAVVLVAPDGSVDVIREAEDLSDVERRDRLPERLVPDSSGR